MTTCPKCKEEIKEGAKKCRHCGADLRNWFVRHKFITGILVLIVLSIVASGGDENNGNENNSEMDQSKQEIINYQIGQSIPTNKLEITITSVDERNQVGGTFFNEKASEGATLVVVNWKYKNVSNEPLNSFSNPNIKLIDETGIEYEADLGKSSAYATEQDLDRKVFSDLNPGITVNDADVFEVSKEDFSIGKWKLKINLSGKAHFVEI